MTDNFREVERQKLLLILMAMRLFEMRDNYLILHINQQHLSNSKSSMRNLADVNLLVLKHRAIYSL